MTWDIDDVRRYCERTGQALPPGFDQNAKKKSTKYHNRPTQLDGKIYPSKHEAERAAELKLLVRSGGAAAVLEQVPFLLAGGVKYVADFVILNWDGTFTVEDAKGVRTKDYSIKKKLMAEKGLTIKEV